MNLSDYRGIWSTTDTHRFLNPGIPEYQALIATSLPDLSAHIWLTTSGTTSLKWVALSKQAFLTSAQAVNDHLEVAPTDIWLNALPTFHVGGLSIYARAYLSASNVIEYRGKWDAQAFYQQAAEATLTALVPTQLYDLIQLQLPSPPSLRAVIIGGARLDAALYQKAKSLNWPVIPSFGMTECASQIATGTPQDPRLKILPHVELKITQDGLVALRSPSLLTGYFSQTWEDPKQDGWLITQDLGHLEVGYFIPEGRANDVVKIGGELINIHLLEEKLDQLKASLGVTAETALYTIPDERMGLRLELAHNENSIVFLQELIEHFNKQVIPLARIQSHRFLPVLPRNALGKLLRRVL